MQLQDERLPAALQSYCTSRLPPASLAALRGTSRTLQQLVEGAPFTAAEPDVSWVLPSGLTHAAHDYKDLLGMLQQQAAVVADLKAGGSGGQHHLPMHQGSRQASLKWQPAWPCQYVALTLVPTAISKHDAQVNEGAAAQASFHLLNARGF